ncbi:hypothetical protein D3C85_333810 [compost metagenome]
MAKEKSSKVKGEKKVRNTANRLTRADKIAKRLRGVSSKTSFKAKSANFVFRVYRSAPVAVHGFIVSEGADSILMRHKRTNASKRMVVSRLAHADIIELYGTVGETSSALIVRETLIHEVVGRLVEDKGGVMTIQTASGETVKLFQNAQSRIEVSVEDEGGSEAGSEGGKKSKKKDKGEKAEKSSKKKKKAKPADDEEDDDLDD